MEAALSPSPRRSVPSAPEAPRGATRRSLFRRAVRYGLGAWFVLGFLPCLGLADAAGSPEYRVKAAFLFNFTKFTDWPAAAFTNAAAPLVLGVLGNDPFGPDLDAAVKNETIRGHPVVVRRFPSGDTPTACHLLFVSRSEQHRLPGLLVTLHQRPVLTVSDLDRFCQQGGMINLVIAADGTVRPEINPAAARATGVKISSKLLTLSLVRLVDTEL